MKKGDICHKVKQVRIYAFIERVDQVNDKEYKTPQSTSLNYRPIELEE